MVTIAFVPKRATRNELVGALTMSATATGISAAPAWSGLKPSTNWMYWLRKKIDPNRAKNTNVTAIDAAENRGFLKKRDVEHRIGRVELPQDERDAASPRPRRSR